MKQSFLPLKRPVLFSLLIHFLCFVIILFTPNLSFRKPKTNIIWVNLPKGASEMPEIKIKEAKSLPKTTIKEQKELAKEEEKEKFERTKEKPLIAPPEKKKQALRRIQEEPIPKGMKKAIPTTPKKKKEKAEWEKALATLEKRPKYAPPEAAQVKEKGEGFKYGTGTEPLRVPPSDPEYVAYQAKVRYKIIQEWILPIAYLEVPQTPRASLVVYIDKEGKITSQEWENRSGNDAFDSSCMRALSRASPLPVPPERLSWEAYNEGFLVEFDPSLKVN